MLTNQRYTLYLVLNSSSYKLQCIENNSLSEKKKRSPQAVTVTAGLRGTLCGLPLSYVQADTHFAQILISGGFFRHNGMVGKYTVHKRLALN